jgi:hypothetical protein
LKLVISEYLRTLREREELDRLLPDLLVEMGYVPIARPQTGNRQFGVDLALRGLNREKGQSELLLLVVKQGDIGRTEWDSGSQAVRPSINEIFDSYLRMCVEPQDVTKPVRIVVATNGELKQTIQSNWSGFVTEHKDRADIEFWGVDRLAELIDAYLFDEHIFRDEDRRDLRRALALSGDTDYDRRDLHRLLLRTLGLDDDGKLLETPKAGKQLIKALRITNLSAQTFASWSINDGDARQGLKAMERALLWSWHRIGLASESDRNVAIADVFTSLWLGYLSTARRYFAKLQPHCHVEDGLFGYCSDGAEFSLVAFEQIGIFATIGLSQVLFISQDEVIQNVHAKNAEAIADTLASLIHNNGICGSPCLDRHSQDITLGMTLLLYTGKLEEAKTWLRRLVRHIDYAFKSQRYIPISSDSLDDLADEGGWATGNTDVRLSNTSWMLATLAGWSVILGVDDCYEVIQRESKECYAETCIQLWHPDKDVFQHLYFQTAHLACGASEAPISLPALAADWRAHMKVIVDSEQAVVSQESMAQRAGIPALELIANRHFSTPVFPFFWYRFAAVLFTEESSMKLGKTSVPQDVPL